MPITPDHAIRIALDEHQPPPIDAIGEVIRMEARAGVMPFNLYDMEALKSLWWEHADHSARVAYVQTTQHIHSPKADAPWGAGAWVRCPGKFDDAWIRGTIFADATRLTALPESWAAATHWHAQAHRKHARFNVKGQARTIIFADAPNKIEVDVIDLGPLPPYWRMEYTALRWCLPRLTDESDFDCTNRHRKGHTLWLCAQIIRQRLDPHGCCSLWIGDGEVALVGGTQFVVYQGQQPSSSPASILLDPMKLECRNLGFELTWRRNEANFDWLGMARGRAHSVARIMFGGAACATPQGVGWDSARRTLDLKP